MPISRWIWGRYCIFGQNADSFLNATVKAEWSSWTHRRTTTEHTLTRDTVVITPIAFNELCTDGRGNDWLPSTAQLKVLLASSPVAPQHRWMLQNSSFENICIGRCHRTQLLNKFTYVTQIQKSRSHASLRCPGAEEQWNR